MGNAWSTLRKRVEKLQAEFRGTGLPTSVAAEVGLVRKRLLNNFIMPLMSIHSAVFLVTYFSPMLALSQILCAGMNIALTAKEFRIRIKALGIDLPSRADIVDVTRWTINFAVFDLFAVIESKASPGVVAIVWAALTVVAVLDTRTARARTIALLVSLVTYAGFSVVHFEESLQNVVVATMTLCLLGLVVAMVDAYIAMTLAQLHEQRMGEVERRAYYERLESEAALGARIRYAAHEIEACLYSVETLELLVSELSSESSDANGRNGATGGVAAALRSTTRLLLAASGETPRSETSIEALGDAVHAAIRRRPPPAGVGVTVSGLDEIAARKLKYSEQPGASAVVVINILRNAVDAVASTHRVGQVSVQFAEDGGRIVVTVRDDGPGMPPAVVSAALNGRAVTTKSTGHGIGLRMVRDLCQVNGFGFAIDSEPGVGTVMKIAIPVVGGSTDASLLKRAFAHHGV